MKEIWLQNRKRRHKRRNTGVTKTASSRLSASNPRTIANRKRRKHRRRNSSSSLSLRNPLSVAGITSAAKKAGMLAIGGVATSVAANLVAGLPFVSSFMVNPYAYPILQGIIAISLINWAGKKVFKAGGELVMLGGLAKAGYDAVNTAVPNISGRIQSALPPIVFNQPVISPSGNTTADIALFPNEQFGDVAYFADSVGNPWSNESRSV